MAVLEKLSKASSGEMPNSEVKTLTTSSNRTEGAWSNIVPNAWKMTSQLTQGGTGETTDFSIDGGKELKLESDGLSELDVESTVRDADVMQSPCYSFVQFVD